MVDSGVEAVSASPPPVLAFTILYALWSLIVATIYKRLLLTPCAASARNVDRGLSRGISVNERLHEQLRLPTALLIVPVLALTNADVDARGGLLGDALGSPVT